MINCIIVDDEPIARRGMRRLVSRREQLKLAGEFSCAEEALEFLENNDADLIFLDIQMPGLDGMELARRLPPRTMVIFTTAYSEYAPESYEVDALDYLLKPIDPARFDKAVDKALDYAALLARAADEADTARVAQDYVIVKADRRYHRVPHGQILYVEGLKDYVILHLSGGTRLITRATIKSMEEMLPAAQFVRVNKSNIVNLDAVDSFDNCDIFIGTAEIAIGATRRDAVMARLFR